MKNSAFSIAALLCVLAACTKDVTIPAQPYDSKWSIQCLITPGKTPQAYVYRTLPFFDTAALPTDLFVRSATVTLATPNGSETLLPDSTWDAARCFYVYFYSGKNAVEAGKNYTLTVKIGSETFTATAATDRRIVQLDSVTYTAKFKDLYGEHEGIQLHFKDPAGKGEFYRFDMGRTFSPTDSILGVGRVLSECSLGKTTWLQEIGRSIYPDKDADGESFTLTIEPTYKHKKGQVGFVRLQSMDEAAYKFYDQYDRQKLAQFNPFVEPVFILPGQFGERAFGVFGAYAVSDSLRFEYPE